MTLRDFLERYGGTLAIVVALVLLSVLLPGDERDGATTDLGVGGAGVGSELDGGEALPEGPAGDAAGGATAGGAGGAAGAAARGGSGRVASGGAGGPAQVAVGKGPNCRPDGRQKGISVYQPPCVDFSGGNGGNTARGVTADKIKVVRYLINIDPATRQILKSAKLSDDPPVVKQAYEALRQYYNQHTQTYGREVEYIDVPARGEDTDDEAMKADAVKIADEIGAFAVIEGDPASPIPTVFAREVAARGVICICTVSLTTRFYLDNKPYMFSSLPTGDEYAAHTSEYISKRLAGKPAKWAGDDVFPPQQMRTKQRKFGLVYIEGNEGRVDRELRATGEAVIRELGKVGVPVEAVSYIYDPGRNQNDMTNMIGTLKSRGVTTVIMVVDPLSPTIITTEATKQQYFPEWFITGFGLSDTTTAARIYDQTQWRHAFGISPLWVTWQNVEKSPGYREFHHGMPGKRKGDEGALINIYYAYPRALFRGIHMAGPNLTADSFARGMFNYPRTGGKPAIPLVYHTRGLPTAIKDFIEIWYDYQAQGPDERGENGSGMIMKVDGGKRWEAGQWTPGESRAFDKAGAVTVTDNPVGGGDPPHEQDGHTHQGKCLSCKA